MGLAYCRFNSETRCNETCGTFYLIPLNDLHIVIDVPFMWKHYMIDHLVQPNEKEREIIMSADPEKASFNNVSPANLQHLDDEQFYKILYVEQTQTGYTHKAGTMPDIEFINKLETILSGFRPIITGSK